MAQQEVLGTPGEIRKKAGKYLTFVLAGETYGLEILTVREIMGLMDITAVPRAPYDVKGVINLRGKVISVIDLRLKFGMPEAEPTDQTCIVVVNVHGKEVGVVVDSVAEVVNIPADEIEDAPHFDASTDTGFLLGMGKIGGRVSMLLDISRVLGGEEGLAQLTSEMTALAGE